MLGHRYSPRLCEDINTPEILRLRARLSAILNRRDHQSLTSVGVGGDNHPATFDAVNAAS